ncbi:MAG: hypothetical protein JL56_10505 [Desulfotomaculum sp. BICA1-6]|nr:MAG: hypothetical protein VR67_06670 [Peptococcaceae bacterium BRH_c8a]KJS73531.1 MAG: hypothetical protein JL56_10505 [Desulfotomaculum sp. BICA1-6]
MLLTTVDIRTEYQVIGMVRGSSMKAKHLGKDIVAFFRQLIGGEVKEYADLLKSAREEAIAQMIREAESLGANAIIGIRFGTSNVSAGAAEIIAYGTAVKI